MARAACRRSARTAVAAAAGPATVAAGGRAAAATQHNARAATCAAWSVHASAHRTAAMSATGAGRSRYAGHCVLVRALSRSAPAAAKNSRGAYVDTALDADADFNEVGIPQVTMLSTEDLDRLERELPPTAVDPGDDVFERNFPSGVVLLQPLTTEHRGNRQTRDADADIGEAKRLVDGLGGGGFMVVTTLRGKTTPGPMMFAKGTTARLGDELAALHVNVEDSNDTDPPVNILFVNTPVITASLRGKLQKSWQGYYVLDRFGVILQIFKTRARSMESKLQVALAEIPYLRGQLVQGVAAGYDRQRGGIGVMGGAGEGRLESRRRLLAKREIAIKRRLEKVGKQQEVVRRGRAKSNVPVIALVGYTNVGKSALLKKLASNLEDDPDRPLVADRLFHTLETTARRARLPSGVDTIVLDSIGFISDLPHGLVDAFRLTLADIQHATVLVHVRDVAHPESERQAAEVMKVLKNEMNLPEALFANMIEVHNKIDLLPADVDVAAVPATGGTAAMAMSCKTGEGVDDFLDEVAAAVLRASGQIEEEYIVPLDDGEQLAWLYRHGSVLTTEADHDGIYLKVMCRLAHHNARKHAALFT